MSLWYQYLCFTFWSHLWLSSTLRSVPPELNNIWGWGVWLQLYPSGFAPNPTQNSYWIWWIPIQALLISQSLNPHSPQIVVRAAIRLYCLPLPLRFFYNLFCVESWKYRLLYGSTVNYISTEIRQFHYKFAEKFEAISIIEKCHTTRMMIFNFFY